MSKVLVNDEVAFDLGMKAKDRRILEEEFRTPSVKHWPNGSRDGAELLAGLEGRVAAAVEQRRLRDFPEGQ